MLLWTRCASWLHYASAPSSIPRDLGPAALRPRSAKLEACQATAKSRRRSAHSPTAINAAAAASKPTSGPAVTSPPGSAGTCVNGERSRTQCGKFSSGPISLARNAATSTTQAIGAARRESPTEDLASAIANAKVDGEPLSDVDSVSYYVIIASAGHDTTKDAIRVFAAKS